MGDFVSSLIRSWSSGGGSGRVRAEPKRSKREEGEERESSGAVSVAVGLFMLAMGETWTCRRDTSVTWHNHYYWGIIIDAVHMSELLLLGGCSGSARAKISFWPSVT